MSSNHPRAPSQRATPTSPAANASLETGLLAPLRRWRAQVQAIEELQRLSGGANQQTWALQARLENERVPLILRRAGKKSTAPETHAVSPVDAAPMHLATEAALIEVARAAGLPVPQVVQVLEPADGLGEGFVMTRIAGETIPRRILRDDQFAAVRPQLAHQCGRILARLHRIPLQGLPVLRRATARQEREYYLARHRRHDHPRPVLSLAFAWLRQHEPQPQPALSLVHGDFRHGNLMIGPDGVNAVLDWELAHLGDPMEDLGWICVNSWRFGHIDLPVGGFGTREALFAGYAAEGGVVDVERVHYWEVMGSLKWAVMCGDMLEAFRSGADRSVERAAIGRRASEAELDLLRLLVPDRRTPGADPRL